MHQPSVKIQGGVSLMEELRAELHSKSKSELCNTEMNALKDDTLDQYDKR